MPKALEVRHEPPSAETLFRLKAPLTVGFADGTAVRVADWSLKALYSADLVGRSLDGAMLSIPFQGVQIYFPVDLQPGESETEFVFHNLTGRQREALALFYRNLLSGRMTSVGDMIVALDTPVDLVPMGETPAEREAGLARVVPRKTRVLVNLAYYGTLFLLVAGFLISVAWARISAVDTLSAHVATATTQILAPVAGYVRELPVAEGANVAAGTVVARLDDQEALRALAEAEAGALEAEDLLAGARGRLAQHMAQAETARSTFRGGPERFDQGAAVNPGDFHDVRLKLEADIAALEREAQRQAARAGTFRERADAMALLVPGPGRVVQHFVRPFDLVRAGDPLTLFESDVPRNVVAYLPPTSVLKVWTGMQADITYMAEGTATVLPGVVDRLQMVGPAEAQTLAATVSVPGLSVEESRRLFIEGMPVEVVLRPRHLQRWFRDLW